MYHKQRVFYRILEQVYIQMKELCQRYHIFWYDWIFHFWYVSLLNKQTNNQTQIHHNLLTYMLQKSNQEPPKWYQPNNTYMVNHTEEKTNQNNSKCDK